MEIHISNKEIERESTTVVQRLLRAEVIKRTISAVILFPLVVWFTYVGSWIYFLFLIAVCTVGTFELLYIISLSKREVKSKIMWAVISLVYLWLAGSALLVIRNSNFGLELSLWMLIVVPAIDIGAYFIGTTFGGARMLQIVSQHKTWSGCCGGIMCALLVGIFFQQIHPYLHIESHSSEYKFNYITLSLFVAVVAQIGDLLESAFKRYFGVKDSSKLLPGHGGVLDRIDSMALVGILIAFFILQ